LLKVKTSLDLDAKVIGHTIGKGRNCGVLGALICALIDDGGAKTFSVGTGFTDEQRKSPPAIGTIIVVKYQELTASGVPRFPVYIGDRADDTAPSC
jgi:DNA ligase-1